jgi:hypothetical protein
MNERKKKEPDDGPAKCGVCLDARFTFNGSTRGLASIDISYSSVGSNTDDKYRWQR